MYNQVINDIFKSELLESPGPLMNAHLSKMKIINRLWKTIPWYRKIFKNKKEFYSRKYKALSKKPWSIKTIKLPRFNP